MKDITFRIWMTLPHSALTFRYRRGSFNQLSFIIGVDSLHNVSGAQTGALDPINGMFWTWNTGYIFAKFEGKSPFSTALNQSVVYHIGGFRQGENAIRKVTLDFPGDQVLAFGNGKKTEIVIDVNLDQWFDGVNQVSIASTPVWMTPGGESLRIADNYATMFSIHELINPMNLKLTIWLVILVFIGVTVMDACKKNDAKNVAAVTPLTIVVPPGFPPITNAFSNNPITQEGFDLGRKLFYDGRLSRDGNFACASCHQQFAGFATFDHNLSHGFNNQFTTRNAPGLANLAWYKEFHWDGGIKSLEVQPLAPLTAPNEMAETVENVLLKLKQDEDYRKKFKAAFGTEDINSQLMLRALSQFMGMLISANSKYDQVKNGTASFTDGEQRGYLVFQQKCATCHKEPLFTDQSFRNTGIAHGCRTERYRAHADYP